MLSFLRNTLTGAIRLARPSQQSPTERAREADLIVLPDGVPGTNCFNCLYVKRKDEARGFCRHPKVFQAVSARNCCAFWDNFKTRRLWVGKEQK